jgi:hypothetical protein
MTERPVVPSFVWSGDKKLPSALFVVQALDLDESQATTDACGVPGSVKAELGREREERLCAGPDVEEPGHPTRG